MELLANDIRPIKLNDVYGQNHLIGEGKILTNLVKNKKLFSMIFYGNPGCGKTSIANALVNELNMPYRMLNAVMNKKTDFDIVIEEAKMNGQMILIIDEIHRMNKDKQDILLPYLENGKIIMIGLTTSNPYHSINPAIRSRCQIFEVKSLKPEDIVKILIKAKDNLEGIQIDNNCLNIISSSSNGDVRSALNLLEMAYYSSTDHIITEDVLKSINAKPIIYIDKNDDNYYNSISALQKSIRGSDVDAAVYYLGVLLEAQDLDIIFRRLSVIAYEDIGLANPSIGPKLDAAINAATRVGFPECIIPLSEIVIEMALSPKSNSAYLAIDKALTTIRTKNCGSVPKHIHTNSKDYLYPHNYKNSWVKQQYLPDNIKNEKFYYPKNNAYENNLNKIDNEKKKQ
ncbi:MAG: replication-associated recombination protein A [Tenericutes bacterium]|nr:replication-associated recombination protein A [Mycoplasmatota bacterium]